ncbi:MAG: imidazole glycerol phosphate synthase subunit HisH [Bacterioplanes sp.]|nr:imidazole glycerol phosphate synthase subunit HisH [Bacterioplanes sp.]
MSRKVCAVIDYGMGNLHSAHGALQTVAPDTQVVVTGDPDVIRRADHVVLPGVGAIRDCMAEIRRLGIDQVVAEVKKTKPLLGICVGLQAMLEHSEENGGVDGMGLFPGKVAFFGRDLKEQGESLKVPHMGWNTVAQVAHPLWHGIADHSRFYFVHSYYVQAKNPDHIKGHGHYGVDFAAALGEDNVFAVQFHPEKSHHAGLALLKNFLAWDGQA